MTAGGFWNDGGWIPACAGMTAGVSASPRSRRFPPSRSIPPRLVRQRHCPRRRAILHHIHGLIVLRLGPELRRLRQARLRAFQQRRMGFSMKVAFAASMIASRRAGVRSVTKILRKIDRYYCETSLRIFLLDFKNPMSVDGIKRNFAEFGGMLGVDFECGWAIAQTLPGQNLHANAAGGGPPLKSSKPVMRGKSKVAAALRPACGRVRALSLFILFHSLINFPFFKSLSSCLSRDIWNVVR